MRSGAIIIIIIIIIIVVVNHQSIPAITVIVDFFRGVLGNCCSLERLYFQCKTLGASYSLRPSNKFVRKTCADRVVGCYYRCYFNNSSLFGGGDVASRGRRGGPTA
jgi:hypothetical protein